MIGLLAAYALALQMLLAGIVATQMAAAGDAGRAVLCYGTGGSPDDSGTAPAHPPHPPCAVCAFAGAAPPLPATAGLAIPQACRRIRPPPLPTGRRCPVRRREPRSSRGPPPAV